MTRIYDMAPDGLVLSAPNRRLDWLALGGDDAEPCGASARVLAALDGRGGVERYHEEHPRDLARAMGTEREVSHG